MTEPKEMRPTEALDGLLPQPVAIPPIKFTKEKFIAWADAETRDFVDLQIDPTNPEQVKDLKGRRAALNKKKQRLDTARKDALKPMREATTRLNNDVKEVTQYFDAAIANCDEYIHESDRLFKEWRTSELEDHYQSFAGDFAELIPFQTFLDLNPKWLNRSTPQIKAQQQLEGLALLADKDRTVLKEMNLEYEEQALLEFAKTLDIHTAIEANNKRKQLDEQAKHYKALTDEIEQAHAETPEPEPESEELFNLSIIAKDLTSTQINQVMNLIKTMTNSHEMRVYKNE